MMSSLLFVTVMVMCQLVVVHGQRTSGSAEYGTRNEPRDTGTQDCSNRMLQMATVFQTIHDDVNALKFNQNALEKKMDANDLNRNGYGCPWLNVDNAVINTVFWSYINVSCLPGYTFNADQFWVIMQCQVNNTWLPLPLSCTRVSCPSLESFTNANLNTTQVSYGTRVNVSCTEGQQLKTSISNWIVTECRADRTWSVKPSNCISKTPRVLTIERTLYGSGGVTAITLINNELFVCRLQENSLVVYDSTSLQLKRELIIPGYGSSEGFAFCPHHNYLYISDKQNLCVHRVDLSTNIITRWNVPGYPYGISVKSSNHNVLMVSYYSKKVQEYTPTGSLVREMSDDHVFDALELDNGNVLISRSGSIHGVVEVTSDFRVIRSYQGSINTPRGSLAKDSEGYVLVLEYGNNRIQVLNPSLTDARILRLPDGITLHGPHALCYDESRGRLYVGEWSGQKRLLVFNNVTNLRALFN